MSHPILRYGLAADSVYLSDDAEIGDGDVTVRIRAELGIRPAHEVIYLHEHVRSTVATWRVFRAQEGTAAGTWAAGTALAFVAEGADPEGAKTINLAHSLSAGGLELDLRDAYRRVKVGTEVIWERDLIPEGASGPAWAWSVYVERGKEGTTEAAHSAGATVVFLAPGET